MYRFVRIDLSVTESDQCKHSFICLLLLGCWAMDGTGRFPCSGHSELVFELENNSLGCLFAEAADFRECCNVRTHDRGFEVAYAHAAQYCECQLGSDTADVVDQQAEQVAFSRCPRAVKQIRLLA